MARQRDTWLGKYVDIAASSTASTLGSTTIGGGALGDFIAGLLIVPEALTAGNIALLDSTSSINIFVSGTLADLTPIWLPLGIRSVNGAWKITTGANVHVRAVGKFS